MHTTPFAVDDDLFDAQTLRAAGMSYVGGADIGECRAAARAIHGTDLEGWHDSWAALADRTAADAAASLAAGDSVSARLAFQRAATYYRTSGAMLLAAPVDPRLKAAMERQTSMFREAMALFGHPAEAVLIPFEGTTLPGYFFRPVDDGAARATVVLTDGYDGSVEELYFSTGATALQHGYNVLAFDGPGQGSVLVDQGIHLRADWENVVTPVLDWLIGRPEVDATRIAVSGLSLGGYLAPRAASEEHRIAAVIADCGAYDLFDATIARIPAPLRSQVREGKDVARKVSQWLMDSIEKKPTAGWALRRNLYVHGADSLLEYLDMSREFTMKGRADRITCPTWVCAAEGDDISATAKDLFAALTCEKVFTMFTAAEGADQHCETAARTLFHSRSLGWLDALLEPRRLA